MLFKVSSMADGISNKGQINVTSQQWANDPRTRRGKRQGGWKVSLWIDSFNVGVVGDVVPRPLQKQSLKFFIIPGREKRLEKEKCVYFVWGRVEFQVKAAQCSRSRVRSEGRGRACGGIRAGVWDRDWWGCGGKAVFLFFCPGDGTGQVWLLTWLLGHPEGCRTSWVQCSPPAIPGNHIPICWEEGCCSYKLSATWRFLHSQQNCMVLTYLCSSELAKKNSIPLFSTWPAIPCCLLGKTRYVLAVTRNNLDPESLYEGGEKQSCDSWDILFPSEQRDIN